MKCKRSLNRNSLHKIIPTLTSSSLTFTHNNINTTTATAPNENEILAKEYKYMPNVDKYKHLNVDIIKSFTSRANNNINSNQKDYKAGNGSVMGLKRNSWIKKKNEFHKERNFNNNTPINQSGIINTERSAPRKGNATTTGTTHLIMKANKLLFANLGRAKKLQLLNFIELSNSTTHTNTRINSNEITRSYTNTKRPNSSSVYDYSHKQYNHLHTPNHSDFQETKNILIQKANIKRSSLVDKYLFKIANPDGVIEDYYVDNDKPSDKYKRFRNQITKGKNKVYRLIQEVKRTQTFSDTMIKVYMTKLKGKHYARRRPAVHKPKY